MKSPGITPLLKSRGIGSCDLDDAAAGEELAVARAGQVGAAAVFPHGLALRRARARGRGLQMLIQMPRASFMRSHQVFINSDCLGARRARNVFSVFLCTTILSKKSAD